MSDIIPVNSSDGFTPYLIGFYVDTEHGWVGAYDKRAIESMIAAVREKALHDAADEIERLRADAERYRFHRAREVAKAHELGLPNYTNEMFDAYTDAEGK